MTFLSVLGILFQNLIIGAIAIYVIIGTVVFISAKVSEKKETESKE